ncbi:MAG: hypothetical protein EOO42_21900 [Flavobacteriales bacterium]|nr:MAG: hypothetical protein EOO42_21900 [Flavobacteriales bacterium]
MDVTNDLHRYLNPYPSAIGFNIPFLVSNGYIVCTPNIYRIKRKPGEAALIAVSTAADNLSKFNWVDSTKMGIFGHSFGGFETNYIATHCNRFRAAIACAGASNMIDIYNDIYIGVGISKQGFIKNSAYSMENDLDKIPNAYIDNSPIFNARSLNVPLLLMHNDGDENVSPQQSKMFFVQLRSLKKKVWLIQYDQEKHTLSQIKNRLDFQNKTMDFFDVYLKGKPMPLWMTDHIRIPKID